MPVDLVEYIPSAYGNKIDKETHTRRQRCGLRGSRCKAYSTEFGVPNGGAGLGAIRAFLGLSLVSKCFMKTPLSMKAYSYRP